jgi:hypothetical protein
MAKRKINLEELPAGTSSDPDEPFDERPIALTGDVRVKQPKTGFASDVRNIANALFADVVMPNVRTIIGDFVVSAIEMILWPERTSRGRDDEPRDYTRYSGRSRERGRSVSSLGRARRPGHRVGEVSRVPVVKDIYFEYKQDADVVLNEMLSRIDDYGWVSVGDLYALSGISGTHNDEQYGWFRLDRARIQASADGYILDLPRPAFR